MNNSEIIARFEFDNFSRGGDAGKGVFKFKNGKQWVTYDQVAAYLAKRFEHVVSLMTDGEHLTITLSSVLPEEEISE